MIGNRGLARSRTHFLQAPQNWSPAQSAGRCVCQAPLPTLHEWVHEDSPAVLHYISTLLWQLQKVPLGRVWVLQAEVQKSVQPGLLISLQSLRLSMQCFAQQNLHPMCTALAITLYVPTYHLHQHIKFSFLLFGFSHFFSFYHSRTSEFR